MATIYHLTAQTKSGVWRHREFTDLKGLIDEFLYYKALQYPFVTVQRRVT